MPLPPRSENPSYTPAIESPMDDIFLKTIFVYVYDSLCRSSFDYVSTIHIYSFPKYWAHTIATKVFSQSMSKTFSIKDHTLDNNHK